MHYRAAAEVQPPLNPDSKLSNDKRGFLGRVSGYATRRDLYADIARNWARSSILLNNIMADQGGLYIHALQPSQYVPGSKPLTDERTAHRVQRRQLVQGPGGNRLPVPAGHGAEARRRRDMVRGPDRHLRADGARPVRGQLLPSQQGRLRHPGAQTRRGARGAHRQHGEKPGGGIGRSRSRGCDLFLFRRCAP